MFIMVAAEVARILLVYTCGFKICHEVPVRKVDDLT